MKPEHADFEGRVLPRGGRMAFAKPGLYGILIVCLIGGFSSCMFSSGKKHAGNDSARIDLPAPLKIPEHELSRFRNACADWFDSTLKRTGFNGGVLVARKGNVVFEQYQGAGHLGGTDTITGNTPFHIASVSKTFTAMAVLKFCQEGKLKLDDAFSLFFPAFNYPGVTIRTLLNHRSGLPNYVYFMETLGWDKKRWISNQDVLDWLISRKAEIKNIGKPDTYFAYCNTNYALLALLLEKLSGKTYAQLMQQLFFQPLQMQNSFVFDSAQVSSVSPSYDWRGQEIPFNFLDAVYGDKNIYSTPRDLFTWDLALGSGKLFSDSLLREAYAPYSNERAGVRNYGLGWRMNLYPDGQKMIYHNGWWHGNNAAFIRLIADSTVIVVLGNKYNRNIYHARELAAIFGAWGNGTAEDEEQAGLSREPGTASVKKAPARPEKSNRAAKRKTGKSAKRR